MQWMVYTLFGPNNRNVMFLKNIFFCIIDKQKQRCTLV